MPLSLSIYGVFFIAALVFTGGTYWKGRSDGSLACLVEVARANDDAARAAFEARSRSERGFDAGRMPDDDPNRRD